MRLVNEALDATEHSQPIQMMNPEMHRPADDSILVLQRVRAGYERTVVLHDVSIDVRRSEIVSIVGPNGAGKSTIAKLIFGFVRPSSGEVTYRGTPIRSPHQAIGLGIGYVPEGRHLFFSLTVWENLTLGLYNKSRRERRDGQKAIDLVFEVFPQLPALRNRRADTLSGGQQQMVAVGRALVAEPELLVLDEPSLGLAPIAVDAIHGSLATIAKSGRSVVLIEQFIDRALAMSNRAYILRSGRIALSGSSEALLAQPDLVEQSYFGYEEDDGNGAAAS